MIYVRGVKRQALNVSCRSIAHARAIKASMIAKGYSKVQIINGVRAVKGA